MRRKAFCAAYLLLAFLLAGAKPYALEERFFRDIQSKKPAVETPAHVPELFTFRPSKGARAAYYTYPIKKINGAWAMAYKDLIHLVGKDRISYLPEDKIITFNQINRVYMAVDKAAVIRQSAERRRKPIPHLKVTCSMCLWSFR